MKFQHLRHAAIVVARLLPVLAQDSTSTTLTAAVTEITPGPEDNYFKFEALQLVDESLDQLDEDTRRLFEFATKNAPSKAYAPSACKLFPGDKSYPSETLMNTLNILLGNSLIKSVPVASVCYEGTLYDAAECDYVASQFNNSYFTFVSLFLLLVSISINIWNLAKVTFHKVRKIQSKCYRQYTRA